MADVRYLLMHRKVLTAAGLHYHKALFSLPRDHQVWRYLFGRGISEKLAKRAMLGFSGGEGLYGELSRQGYLHSVIFAKRLVKSNKNKDLSNADFIDFFGKGRVIFPCLENGRVLGITSRICYETTNMSIPRYKVLGGSSYSFCSPDSVKAGNPIVVVEGPMDALVLQERGIEAVCFLGTSGFKSQYGEHLKQATTIYCMPDAEINTQSRKANMNMYITIANATGKMPVVLSIPIGLGGKKMDPADHFRRMGKEETIAEINRLVDHSCSLDETKEWHDYQRKLRDDQRTKEQRTQTMEEGDALEKFPIIPTLELLDIDVQEGYSARPTCVCFNPEHDDTQPSVHIYESTQTFHCFGCNAGHDAIDAVRMVKGLGFNDAIDWLKEHLYEEQDA